MIIDFFLEQLTMNSTRFMKSFLIKKLTDLSFVYKVGLARDKYNKKTQQLRLVDSS